MPELAIEPMNNAAAWVALAADGITPSVEISMSDERAHVRYGPDGRSGLVTAGPAATGHLLRRTLSAPVDLSPFTELRLWIRASRQAQGSALHPFFLELRVGSATLPPDAPGNAWHRYLPVAQPATWELHRLSISDLAPAVRSAARTLQLRCLAAPFTCYLDDVAAVREEMVGDVESALVARLHQQISLKGSPVPALVRSPDVAPPSTPCFRFTRLSIEHADQRTQSGGSVRSDYSSAGHAIRPPSFAYDLRYQLDVFAGTPADEARLLDFALERLPPRGELLVNGVPLALEMAALPAEDLIAGHRTDRVGLGYRVQARREIGAAQAVRPVNAVLVEADMKVA
jgi:hypothetical protein